MNVLVTGGTGLVGRALLPRLREAGHAVTNLSTRRTDENPAQNGIRHLTWQPGRNILPAECLEWADAVIHLAGYPVSHRWTRENKRRMESSRIDTTQWLTEKMISCTSPPRIFISASASGYYASSPDWQSEEASAGSGYLSGLVRQWEKASEALLSAPESRRVLLRFGLVLAREGGALPRLSGPIRAGIGAPVGPGDQWVPWIHLQDLTSMILHCLHTPGLNGVFNAVSPHPSTQKELAHSIARALGRRIWLPPIPPFTLRLALGEMAEMLLASHRLSASRILSTGFHFEYADLESALRDLLSPSDT